jgi:hypothetical protein
MNGVDTIDEYMTKLWRAWRLVKLLNKESKEVEIKVTIPMAEWEKNMPSAVVTSWYTSTGLHWNWAYTIWVGDYILARKRRNDWQVSYIYATEQKGRSNRETKRTRKGIKIN